MGEEKPAAQKIFMLTPEVVSNLDIGRLIREAEKLDDFLYQTTLRSPGTSMAMPKTTRTLERLAEANGISMAEATHRKHLIGNLRALRTSGRRLHISFAVEPSPAVVQKIVAWMRANIDPNLIIEVGIQPNISVGCVVRTTNKIFDMSLRSRFKNSKQKLAELLESTK